MGRKYRVISADGHVETPPDTFVKYVPERWRDRAPRLAPSSESSMPPRNSAPVTTIPSTTPTLADRPARRTTV